MIDRDRILELHSLGWSRTAIASELGCSEASVRRLRLAPHKPPPKRWMTPEEIQRIEAMLDDGCSYTEIERTTGRSASHIVERWPGRGWDAGVAGEFRQYTARLWSVVDQRWSRHLRAAS